ncbi:hypothetical protein R1flu_002545 [Riccia fluitans]|uniref:Uncharacterized protein n=1 Tax=Riccia fluitans TaxID=41844 RepID=A0ABD1Y6Y2_9MARC
MRRNSSGAYDVTAQSGRHIPHAAVKPDGKGCVGLGFHDPAQRVSVYPRLEIKASKRNALRSSPSEILKHSKLVGSLVGNCAMDYVEMQK